MTKNKEESVLTNPQVASIAVYLLGGKSKYIDTEDVALKAFELAPERFAWRKYPDEIDLGAVKYACSDARKPNFGGLLIGSPTKGWMLTEEGLVYAKAARKRLTAARTKRERVSGQDKRLVSIEKTRLLSTTAYEKYATGRLSEVTIDEAWSFFRVNDYITGKSRTQKIIRIKNLFASDSDLGELVQYLANKLDGGA
jgi:hypothetical protein